MSVEVATFILSFAWVFALGIFVILVGLWLDQPIERAVKAAVRWHLHMERIYKQRHWQHYIVLDFENRAAEIARLKLPDAPSHGDCIAVETRFYKVLYVGYGDPMGLEPCIYVCLVGDTMEEQMAGIINQLEQ